MKPIAISVAIIGAALLLVPTGVQMDACFGDYAGTILDKNKEGKRLKFIGHALGRPHGYAFVLRRHDGTTCKAVVSRLTYAQHQVGDSFMASN